MLKAGMDVEVLGVSCDMRTATALQVRLYLCLMSSWQQQHDGLCISLVRLRDKKQVETTRKWWSFTSAENGHWALGFISIVSDSEGNMIEASLYAITGDGL
ncbi:hypothetical protein O9992_16520 [Vibrio lentus]|nr:hypothetical protein [Vibrio lentus]